MGFYGNIVNYFSAAFKKFKFRDNTTAEKREAEESLYNEVEAALSQDELIFESSNENFIEYHYKEEPSEENDRMIKTMDMQLNVEALREDSTVDIVPQGTEEYPEAYKIYQDNGENGEHLDRGEIKYYAKYNPNTGNLFIPFIHIKEETE